jgi:hypothetical protein
MRVDLCTCRVAMVGSQWLQTSATLSINRRPCLHPGVPSGLIPSGFLTNNIHVPSILSYMPRPSHPPRLDHSHYTW